MKDHAVVLKAESSRQLRIGRELFLVDFTVAEHLGDLFIQFVNRFDITLVKLEMHIESLVGDAIQSVQVELLWLVDSRFDHGTLSF